METVNREKRGIKLDAKRARTTDSLNYHYVKNGNPLLIRRGAGSERSAARLLFDCLIVEVTAPDGIDSRWVQQAVENAIDEQLGKRLTL
jgi:hypothetical protein